jgi:hypothetical protein
MLTPDYRPTLRFGAAPKYLVPCSLRNRFNVTLRPTVLASATVLSRSSHYISVPPEVLKESIFIAKNKS